MGCFSSEVKRSEASHDDEKHPIGSPLYPESRAGARSYVPISVRTRMSSGKNSQSIAFLRKETPDDPPVPGL